MTPSSPTTRNLCYLPFYPAHFGTAEPELRLALHSIIDNPRGTVNILL
jgi:hypothetical protein